jgi:hypothetical protein
MKAMAQTTGPDEEEATALVLLPAAAATPRRVAKERADAVRI